MYHLPTSAISIGLFALAALASKFCTFERWIAWKSQTIRLTICRRNVLSCCAPFFSNFSWSLRSQASTTAMRSPYFHLFLFWESSVISSILLMKKGRGLNQKGRDNNIHRHICHRILNCLYISCLWLFPSTLRHSARISDDCNMDMGRWGRSLRLHF